MSCVFTISFFYIEIPKEPTTRTTATAVSTRTTTTTRTETQQPPTGTQTSPTELENTTSLRPTTKFATNIALIVTKSAVKPVVNQEKKPKRKVLN